MNDTVRRIGTAYLLGTTWFVIMLGVSLVVFGLTYGLEPLNLGSMPLVHSIGSVTLGVVTATIIAGALWLRLQASRQRTDPTGPAQAGRRADERADAPRADAPLASIR